MGQRQPKRPARWEPRWARLLDELGPVEEALGDTHPPSPADVRRVGQQGKALAGVTATVLAAAVAALVLWHLTASGLGAMFRQEAPRAATPAPAGARLVVAPAPTTVAPTAAPSPTTPLSTTVAVSTTAATATTPSSVPTPIRAPTTTAARTEIGAPRPARSHVVERGDTLFSIARLNGTTVGDLVAANGLASSDAVLSVGRRLAIPG